MTEIKLLIVDDLEHVRQGLRTVLELASDLVVVGEACNGLEAIQQVDRLHPDVVLMDLVMPQRDGLEAAQSIKADYPDIGLVLISIHDDEEMQAKAAGADAFLAKGTDTETLIQTIQQVGEEAQGR